MIELNTKNIVHKNVVDNVYAVVTIYVRDNVLNNVRANVSGNVMVNLKNHTKLK